MRRLADAYEAAKPEGRFVLRAVRRAEEPPAVDEADWGWMPLGLVAALLLLSGLAGGVTGW